MATDNAAKIPAKIAEFYMQKSAVTNGIFSILSIIHNVPVPLEKYLITLLINHLVVIGDELFS